MKPPFLKKWNNIEHTQELLFFAQALDELLFHHTVDSFKSPALNLHHSVMEVLFLSKQLVQGRIKRGSIGFAIDELLNHLRHDPVYTSYKPTFWESIISVLKNKEVSHEKLVTTIEALAVDISGTYWEKLTKCICEAVLNKGTSKKRITSLARVFTAELEMRGFSKRFAYFEVRNFFFNAKASPDAITESDQIYDFFESFSGNDFSWRVIYKCSSNFKKYEDLIKAMSIDIDNKSPLPTSCKSKIQDFLQISDELNHYLSIDNIRAKDRYIAREVANKRIEVFSDICCFSDHSSEIYWSTKAVVENKTNASLTLLKPPPNPMQCASTRYDDNINSRLRNTIEIFAGIHFSSDFSRAFRKAIDYHQAALEAKTAENQLLNLWASLEGLVPPPLEGDFRINYFLKLLIPTLSLTYTGKIFKYISDCLEHSGDDIKTHVNSCTDKENFYYNTVCLLVAQDKKEDRTILFKKLNGHPLLRYRCFWANQNFSSTKKIKKTLTSRQEKISWHIQRIYTMRNQIIHNAESLPYLESLVENLHSYVDILIETITKFGKKSNISTDCESVLKLISMYKESYIKDLSKDNVYCDSENFVNFIFLRDNTLNPFYYL